jgi:HK97 family phage prohead protease
MDRFVTLLARAEAPSEGVLRGYAAVYDQPTRKQRDYKGTETIGRGAFDALLQSDVLALVDHDPGKVLGRTSSGTLRLGSDGHGLTFEVDLPDTQLARDTYELVRRGDLNGCSFTAAVGQVERTKGGVVHRSFSRLVDVSVVSLPAYDGTAVMARSADPEWVREQLIRARARVRFEGKQNG